MNQQQNYSQPPYWPQQQVVYVPVMPPPRRHPQNQEGIVWRNGRPYRRMSTLRMVALAVVYSMCALGIVWLLMQWGVVPDTILRQSWDLQFGRLTVTVDDLGQTREASRVQPTAIPKPVVVATNPPPPKTVTNAAYPQPTPVGPPIVEVPLQSGEPDHTVDMEAEPAGAANAVPPANTAPVYVAPLPPAPPPVAPVDHGPQRPAPPNPGNTKAANGAKP